MLKNVINRHRTALMRQCSVMLVEGRLLTFAQKPLHQMS
jgi:hypothetical protein